MLPFSLKFQPAPGEVEPAGLAILSPVGSRILDLGCILLLTPASRNNRKPNHATDSEVLHNALPLRAGKKKLFAETQSRKIKNTLRLKSQVVNMILDC